MASTTMTWSILTGAKSTEGSIKYIANHALIPAAQVLEEAQAWIYQRLRVREMIAAKNDLTIAVAASSIDMATDVPGFQQPLALRIDGYGKLTYRREEDFPRDFDTDAALPQGHPTCWTIVGETLYFDSQIDTDTGALNGRLWYYGTPALLSASNETNFLTDKYPTLLRRAILARAYESRNREDLMVGEEKLAERAIQEANVTNDDFRYGQEL